MKVEIRILRKCGVNRRHTGYIYLRDAIRLVQKKQGRHVFITKEIYPMIAQKHETTEFCVERNIRTAINRCWQNNPEYIQEILGYRVEKCPGNAEFISSVVYYLEEFEEEATVFQKISYC